MPKVTPLLIAIAAFSSASAQQARDGGDTARFQAMIQQLTQERADLQERNSNLESDLKKAMDGLAAAKAEIESLHTESSRLENSLQQESQAKDRNAQVVTQLRGQLDELVAQFRQTIMDLRDTETKLDDVSAQLEAVQSERDECVTNNLELYRTGNEVIDAYEQKGCFAAARQHEPFTQLKRVQIENLVDKYKWRLDDELLPQNADAAEKAADIADTDVSSADE